VKRPESVIDKIYRKGTSRYPDGLSEDSLRRMRDIIGARVVVYFLSDLAFVRKAIESATELEIDDSDQPVAYLPPDWITRLSLPTEWQQDKTSGYTSLHYVVRFRPTNNRRQTPWMELQVRTLAQEAWAQLQHILGYKPGFAGTPYIEKQLQIQSMHRQAFDETFSMLRDEFDTRRLEHRDVADLEFDAGSLPIMLHELGILVNRDELQVALRILASRGLRRPSDLRDVWRSDWVEMIRNCHVALRGREPTGLQMLACLANLHGASGDVEAQTRIEAQVNLDEAWDRISRKVASRPSADSALATDAVQRRVGEPISRSAR
jgi:ppGpp synthetase/RelA/SpoT-type nucleotidyltranferase